MNISNDGIISSYVIFKTYGVTVSECIFRIDCPSNHGGWTASAR